ncbi:hypothetical protein PQR34_44010 [Paraburkholderia sediminicola]|uniref:hypothetical protein n=1 Tax=Paraburkholderia sediminicola TaxID=458836 RepID=UPI0038B99D92
MKADEMVARLNALMNPLRTEVQRVLETAVALLDDATRDALRGQFDKGRDLAVLCDGQNVVVAVMDHGEVCNRVLTVSRDGEIHVHALQQRH